MDKNHHFEFDAIPVATTKGKIKKEGQREWRYRVCISKTD
jgi:hypothetical protein